jgi:transmembrane 9 superfamily protein 2/4
MAKLSLIFLIACILLVGTQAYLPGVQPKNYKEGEKVPLRVNKLTSVHRQLPFKYYSLPFCKPDKVVDEEENLGEVLLGDRIESSTYEIYMGKSETCKILCKKEYTLAEVTKFAQHVRYEYRAHWVLDNLPAATPKTLTDVNQHTTTVYESGFFLGAKNRITEGGDSKKYTYYLNNHVNIKLKYHENPSAYEGKRVVGFEVEPKSKAYPADLDPATAGSDFCISGNYHLLELKTSKDSVLPVTWTYSVIWEEDAKTPWANRWDRYLEGTDDQIHWFSIINSMMIVLFLTGMVAMIMMRTLHADFRRYNQIDPNEEAEETGWKLVHGDVFRPPSRPMLLSVLVGSGVQVFGMTVVTLVFAVLGFLSPANRGGLMTSVIVLFIVMGVFAGYFSTRNYRMFKGTAWKKNTVLTAVLFPGTVFGIFMFINFFIASQHSSGAVNVATFFSLVALWFGISLPLVFFGSYFAYKKPVPEHPVRTNQIPRQIPEQVWYMSPIFSILMGGILPFGAVFIELFFILSAIWGHQFYYIFGFLFMVFVILILTCAEITIVMCYFQLCSEDYHWWWRSYLTAGASAFYMFLYSVFYFFTRLEIQTFVSKLLYFGYTLIMSLAFFVLTGSIGYYACLFFVRKIYSQVKVD